ncbi:hypothetical protein M8J76_014727 [Diaphorina citri]|nr:hypothetical protein M8J76_014727 [Diaphorina citri]
MSVYFDYKVNLCSTYEAVTVVWHSQLPLLGVGVNVEESNGGSVYICDELGESLSDVTPPLIPSIKLTQLCWHPSRKLLVGGWASGVLRVWMGGSEWISIASVHGTAILQLQWSQLGTRLACLDQSGLLSCWQLSGPQAPSLVYKQPLPGEPSCLTFLNAAPGLDVSDLARRAVAGDARALDMFSAWRPRTGGRRPGLQTDATGLFVGTLAGNIYHVNGEGVHIDVLSNESPVRSLLHHPTQPVLITLTQGPVIGHYISDSDGALTEVTKVKLNGVKNDTGLVWAGNSTLAFPTQEFRVRIWEIDSGESYLLQGGGRELPPQWMTSVSYSADKKLLCGGSNLGNIIIWKRSSSGWDEAATCTVSAVQTSAAQLSITSVSPSSSNTSVHLSTELSTEFQVAGVAVSKQNIVVWSGKIVAVYRLETAESGLTISALGSFGCECERILIFDQSLLVLSLSGDLAVHTLQGTIKQSLRCDSQVLCVDMNDRYVSVATASAYLYVWDMSRREAKLVTSPKDLSPLIPNLGEVMQCRINSNATQVSLTVAYTNLLPSPILNVCLLDVGVVNTFSYNQTTR